jgi:hypothetical protein
VAPVEIAAELSVSHPLQDDVVDQDFGRRPAGAKVNKLLEL